ncbi:MAG: FAD-binding oxidoreductase [Deltaproteobacteria bacterium]|nr:MAG: FAD-binding oxidoreductase [Deltaproteobacteria bacterium]
MSDETQKPAPLPLPLRLLRGVGRLVATVALTSVLAGVGTFAWLEQAPDTSPHTEVVDVTQLIHIDTDRIATPTDTAELRRQVAMHDGPISIGGGRFSMGGQIATEQTLFLDMREMDDVLALDVENKTARVEAGITWRTLIEHLDPHDLSVKIMQSYANFTVGGSLSVNAHGRYVNEGPVVHSVRAIELVLADGTLVRCSRDEHSDLFWAAVGGYGAVGVIATVELDLADNVPMARSVARMHVDAFEDWFAENIRGSDSAIYFNADLYPPAYDDLVAITFSETDQPLTVTERLQAGGESSSAEKFMYWWVSEAPLGKEARSEVIDRLRLADQPVIWRNYEASYDVAGLEPASRESSTYVLQEYFIPVEHFADFVPKMAEVFTKHEVNVVNVSIRHASAEPDSLLSWAPGETYAFVIYYKMGTDEAAWKHARTWSREMDEAILDAEGVWYLPYQIHATPEQFHRAYPRAEELFAVKRRVDPHYQFRNKLWDAYLPPTAEYGGASDEETIRARLATREGWNRPEDQTFLTLPEWLIVYSADELGAFLDDHRPSEFPYFAAIGQFWTNYRAVYGRVRDHYEFNTGYHLMIGVIGASYTVEMAGKGLYEHTLGRLFESAARVPEEDAYARITAEYGAFTHHTPWYAFDFPAARASLADVDGAGLRGTERQVVTRIELTLKSWWAWCIGAGTGAAYDPEAERLEVWVRGDRALLDDIDGLTVLDDLGGRDHLVSVPRYEPFTAAALTLARRDVDIVSIAGGERLLVQVQADRDWDDGAQWAHTVVEWPMLSDPGRKRVAFEVPVRRLDAVVPALESSGATIEHVYDF